jgi:vacuolar protein sorting-associated protein 53
MQARDDLTDAMCKKEMGVYTAIFGTTGDTAALERTDRRYLWLRKRLGSRQEVRL